MVDVQSLADPVSRADFGRGWRTATDGSKYEVFTEKIEFPCKCTHFVSVPVDEADAATREMEAQKSIEEHARHIVDGVCMQHQEEDRLMAKALRRFGRQ